MNHLKIRDIVHHYGKSRGAALDGVGLDIGQNEFFTLLGPSGCGKTTLLRILAGFELPVEGEVSLQGEPLLRVPPWERPVNTVFQNYALFPHLSILRNVTFGLKMRGVPKAERHARAREALQLVRLTEYLDRRPAELSGGQQQRVALARALACKPKLLLLDEPLSALDYKLRKEMQGELKRLQVETATTFVFVTHDQEEALAMSDRIAVMNSGRIEQIGTPTEIYSRPRTRFVAGFIGESNIFDAAPDASGALRLADGTPVGINLARGCQVVIRPEAMSIDPQGPMRGLIDELTFTGSATRISVQLEDGLGRAYVNAPGAMASTLSRGQALRLAFDPKQIAVIDA
jgi:spermidine/putrescine transport system ATP-binding protein